MKLKELIGSKIIEVKYHYSPSNEYQLQEFYSYLLLNNGLIFSFPTYEDESNFDSIESQEYFNNKFKTGSKISNKVKPLIVGQKISNLHFPYFQDEPEFQTIQKIVNGYFTIITLPDNKLMYVNEEGYLKKLKVNNEASKLIGYTIYGKVLIVG